jgi:1-deoxy-D-xylulose-5-phosphate reductoisomerase
MDLASVARLDFELPDVERFPALRVAREALQAGGAAPIVLNAANEVAVASFLAGGIRFSDIVPTVERALAESDAEAPRSIGDVLDIDRAARRGVESAMKAYCQ